MVRSRLGDMATAVRVAMVQTTAIPSPRLFGQESKELHTPVTLAVLLMLTVLWARIALRMIVRVIWNLPIFRIL